MPRGAYVLAKMAMAMLFAAIISLMLAVLAATLAGVALSAVAVAAAAGGERGWARCRSARSGLYVGSLVSGSGAPAVVNIVYLPMAFLSGLWMPLKMLPPIFDHARAGVAVLAPGPARAEGGRTRFRRLRPRCTSRCWRRSRWCSSCSRAAAFRADGRGATVVTPRSHPRRTRHARIAQDIVAAAARTPDPGGTVPGLDTVLPAGLPGVPVPAGGARLAGRDRAVVRSRGAAIVADTAVDPGVPAAVLRRLSNVGAKAVALHARDRRRSATR